jgi:hypothetical protein
MEITPFYPPYFKEEIQWKRQFWHLSIWISPGFAEDARFNRQIVIWILTFGFRWVASRRRMVEYYYLPMTNG